MSVSSLLRSLLVLRLIAAFKFVKAFLVAGTGLGLLSMHDPVFVATLRRFADSMPYQFEQNLLRAALAVVSGLSSGRIQLVAMATFLYAGLFFVEGVGLWRGRHWAEWLTVVATGSLIPIELYELAVHRRAGTILVIALNVAILGYLIWRIRGPGARGRTPSS